MLFRVDVDGLCSDSAPDPDAATKKKPAQPGMPDEENSSSPEDKPLAPWKGPADYSGIKDPPNVGASTKPTPRQVREMKAANRAQNDDVLRSDISGAPLVDSAKSQKGVTPRPDEAQVDHKNPVDKGGTREGANLQLASRQENRSKSNKVD